MLDEKIKYLASALYEYCKSGIYESDAWISHIEDMFSGSANFMNRKFLQTFRIHFYSGISLTFIIEGKKEEGYYSLKECETAIEHAFHMMGLMEV